MCLREHNLYWNWHYFCCRSSFSDFAQKYAKDERFKGVEKMRERESLFNEYLIEVRKREKEEKSQRREQVSIDQTYISSCGETRGIKNVIFVTRYI